MFQRRPSHLAGHRAQLWNSSIELAGNNQPNPALASPAGAFCFAQAAAPAGQVEPKEKKTGSSGRAEGMLKEQGKQKKRSLRQWGGEV